MFQGNSYDNSFLSLTQGALTSTVVIVPKATDTFEVSGTSFTLKCYGALMPITTPTSSSKITVS